MADPRDYSKNIGQALASTVTPTAIYTVPSWQIAHIARIFFCNTWVSNGNVSIAVAKAWAVDTAAQYIYYNLPIPAGDTFLTAPEIWLESWDVVRAVATVWTIAIGIRWAEWNYRGE